MTKEHPFRGSTRWYDEFSRMLDEMEKTFKRDPTVYQETAGLEKVLGYDGYKAFKTAISTCIDAIEKVRAREDLF